MLEKYDDAYFVTMTQVIQWMQNPRTKSEVKSFEPWKDKCDVPEGRSCSVSVRFNRLFIREGFDQREDHFNNPC